MRQMVLLALIVMLAGCSKTPPMTSVHGKSIEHWMNALGDKDMKKRRKAVEVLGNVGTAHPDVLPALIAALKDRDAPVRVEAVLALHKIGPPAQDAIAALTELSKDRDVVVRANAAKALERIQSHGQ